MGEIAVEVLFIHFIAQNVYVLKEEEGAVEELQLVVGAIRVGLLMGIVMISTTLWPAPTMEEIAVELVSIQIIAQNVNVLNEKGKARIQNLIWKMKRKKDPPNILCILYPIQSH